MGDLYSEIRERSKQDYGQKFEEWAPRILVDQYSDRTHFIFRMQRMLGQPMWHFPFTRTV